MAFKKIEALESLISRLANRVTGQAAYIKDYFDGNAKQLMNAHNELIDELNANGAENLSAVRFEGEGIRKVRLNEDGQLEGSDDGERWYTVSGGGHVVLDESGTALPQRSRMKFMTAHLSDDGEATVISAFKGDKGEKGEKGDTGATGLQGMPGKVYRPYIDEVGYLRWRLSDEGGSEPEPADVKGPQGIQGEQGVQGMQGLQGIPGNDGREVEMKRTDTHICWRYSGDSQWTELIEIASLKGDAAATIRIGSVATLPYGSEAQVTNSGNENNVILNFALPEGPIGPKGETGEKGEQGVQGIQGIQGVQGEKGEQGHSPQKGVDYWTQADKDEIVSDVMALLPKAYISSAEPQSDQGNDGDIWLVVNE